MHKIIILLITAAAILMAQDEPPPLEDNSFLIEEAYNQEAGVIQHIFKGLYSRERNFELIFSEEVPLFNEKNQFSLETSFMSLNKSSVKGISDLTLQYRYQLMDKEDWAASAPAFSVIFPIGNRNSELGTNNTGFQFLLPVSRSLSKKWIAHFNAGAAFFTGTEDESFTEYFLGGSLIWLIHPNFNIMLEYLMDVSGAEQKNIFLTEHQLVPGARYAINLGELQVVPAAALIIVPGTDFNIEQYLFYLSFEHPF